MNSYRSMRDPLENKDLHKLLRFADGLEWPQDSRSSKPNNWSAKSATRCAFSASRWTLRATGPTRDGHSGAATLAPECGSTTPTSIGGVASRLAPDA